MADLKGKFIVLEGLDGAGGSTQIAKLHAFLLKKGLDVERLSYPDYSSPIGQMLLKMLRDKEFRSKGVNFTPALQFLLFAADMVKDSERIADWIERGKTVIADRYFTSTLAYQSAMGFPVKRGLEFAEMFRLPRPDMIIYLKIRPETSGTRKRQEGSLDWFEEDGKFLSKVAEEYDHLAKGGIFGEWKVVDAEKGIEEVARKVAEALGL